MPRRGFAYMRYSTEEQSLGHSERRQRGSIEPYALSEGIEIVEWYFDKGLSGGGTHLEHGELGRLMDDIRAGDKIKPGDCLLIERWNRFSRQELLDALSLFIDVVKRGRIVIITTRDRQIYDAKSGAEKLTRLLNYIEEANNKIEELKRDLKLVWVDKWNDARAGKFKPTNHHVSWVEPKSFVEVDGKKWPLEFELPKEHETTINKIFDIAGDEGKGSRLIARKLNEINRSNDGEFYATFDGQPLWNSSMVENVLSSRAVLGEFQPSVVVSRRPYRREPIGEPIPNYYPAAITQAKWDKAYASRESNRKFDPVKRKYVRKGGRDSEMAPNLFVKLAKCAYCGSNMQMLNLRRIYLACPNDECISRDKLSGLGRTGWRYFDFEGLFLANVRKLGLQSFFQTGQHSAKIREINDRVYGRQNRRKELNATIENLLDETEKTNSGPDRDRLRERRLARQAELDQLDVDDEKDNEELGQLKEQDKAAADVKDIMEIVEQLQKPMRKEAVDEKARKEMEQLASQRAKLRRAMRNLISKIIVAYVGERGDVAMNYRIAEADGDEEAMAEFGEQLKDTFLKYFSVEFKDGVSSYLIWDGEGKKLGAVSRWKSGTFEQLEPEHIKHLKGKYKPPEKPKRAKRNQITI